MGGLGPICAVAPQKKHIRTDKIFARVCEECDNFFCAKVCHKHWYQSRLTDFVCSQLTNIATARKFGVLLQSECVLMEIIHVWIPKLLAKLDVPIMLHIY
jgi:hypothetical protein